MLSCCTVEGTTHQPGGSSALAAAAVTVCTLTVAPHRPARLPTGSNRCHDLLLHQTAPGWAAATHQLEEEVELQLAQSCGIRS